MFGWGFGFTKKTGFLSASFNIEAAVVVPLVLTALCSLIKWDIDMHDMIVSASTANETVELYGHMGEDMDASGIAAYENERLGLLFSGAEYSLSLDGSESSAAAAVSGGGSERTYTGKTFRPEEYMRQSTILEEVLGGD